MQTWVEIALGRTCTRTAALDDPAQRGGTAGHGRRGAGAVASVGQRTASVRQLSEVLLRDASLTSQVLRISNSAFFNPRREPISTISRAIVVIGFEQVRMIALSISLLDGLHSRAAGAQLLALLAQSFHAALQARTLAEQVCRRDKEQVFIATLLQHVGEMAFWSQSDPQVEQLAERLCAPGAERERIVRDTLGISFRELSLGLLKSWNMDEVQQLVNDFPALKTPTARCVDLGTRIASVLPNGWGDEQTLQQLQQEVANLTDLPEDEALELLHDGSRQAPGAGGIAQQWQQPAGAAIDWTGPAGWCTCRRAGRWRLAGAAAGP